MIIDVHTHLMMGTEQKDKEDILQAAERYGVERFYVSTLYGEKFYPTEEEIALCNRQTYLFSQENPKLIRGYCYVNPRNTDTMTVLRRGFEEYGMPGVKLWVATVCDDPLVEPIMEWCIEHQLPVLVHAFYKATGLLPHESTGENVARLAQKYPQAKIIMAHLGANCYHGVKAVRAFPNVYTDISGSLCRGDDIDYTVQQLSENRVLFGTDLPQPGSLLGNLGRVREACLTDLQREKILCRNAIALFGEV